MNENIHNSSKKNAIRFSKAKCVFRSPKIRISTGIVTEMHDKVRNFKIRFIETMLILSLFDHRAYFPKNS